MQSLILSKVDFASNKSHSEGLCEILRDNISMSRIKLEKCKIPPALFIDMRTYTGINKTLANLEVTFFHFSEEDVVAFGTFIKHSHLKSLSVNQCTFDS